MSTQLTTYTDQPIKFLGATVLSFNTSLGLGYAESSLNVTLIEDCETDPPQKFRCNLNDGDPDKILVGDPVVFEAGSFKFGGIVRNWDLKFGSNGRTYVVNITDPRQLLSNVSVIYGGYRDGPITAANYVNVYKHREFSLCSDFGKMFNTEEGSPYLEIMTALEEVQNIHGPFVCSPTCSARGENFLIDFTTFPGGSNSPFVDFPYWYRLANPSAPLLEILTQASEVAGFEFYVYLDWPDGSFYPIIRIGLVDLRNMADNFGQVVNFINSFPGTATELSYGQEVRIEPTKTVLFGEQLHYLTETNTFLPFFGEEIQNGNKVLIVPYGWDNLGFWIYKNTEDVDLSLTFPLNGIYQISEMDIRFAMSSFKSWMFWVFIVQAAGSLNDRIRQMYPIINGANFQQILIAIAGGQNAMEAFSHWIDQAGNGNAGRLAADFANHPSRIVRDANMARTLRELETIHGWLSGLGNTYYGKKYLCKLNEGICYYYTTYPMLDGDGKPVFSSNPTESAWVDPGIPILQLQDPFLEVFRDESGKIGGFAAFNTDGIFGELGSGADAGGNFGVPKPGEAGGGPASDDVGFCWVAREVYGEHDIRWLIFRQWLLTEAPDVVSYLYGKYGKYVAKFIHNKSYMKKLLKYFMDKIINRYLDRK